MLLKFIVKNFLSFKEETEFNLFPSSKSQQLKHHKTKADEVDILRMSALYGANGSGKSNLIKSIATLKNMIVSGEIENDIEQKKFKLDAENKTHPIDFAIEFNCNNKNYYYTVSINNKQVVYEYLAISTKAKDEMIFERKIEDEKQGINFYEEFLKDEKNKYTAETLAEKFLEKNQLLLSLLATKYTHEFNDTQKVYEWFVNQLKIITPEVAPSFLAHILDRDKTHHDFLNKTMLELNTGISSIEVDIINEEANAKSDSKNNTEEDLENLVKIKNHIKNIAMMKHPETNEELTLTVENNSLISKRVFTKHQKKDGTFENFKIPEESNGTQRLLDLIPAFYYLTKEYKTFIIDEIESSIHPLTIKGLISKFSKDTEAKGQLIFSTHESCLLDQDIIRTDEVWFAQKDSDGCSRLYSLSDFKVHNTINIENNYLSGRYGAIPFLTSLKDLNWHTHENVTN